MRRTSWKAINSAAMTAGGLPLPLLSARMKSWMSII